MQVRAGRSAKDESEIRNKNPVGGYFRRSPGPAPDVIAHTKEQRERAQCNIAAKESQR